MVTYEKALGAHSPRCPSAPRSRRAVSVARYVLATAISGVLAGGFVARPASAQRRADAGPVGATVADASRAPDDSVFAWTMRDLGNAVRTAVTPPPPPPPPPPLRKGILRQVFGAVTDRLLDAEMNVPPPREVWQSGLMNMNVSCHHPMSMQMPQDPLQWNTPIADVRTAYCARRTDRDNARSDARANARSAARARTDSASKH